GVSNVECVEPTRCPVEQPPIGIVSLLSRLIAAPKPNKIGRQHTMPGGNKNWNHFSIEIGPGRFSVQQNYRLSKFGPFINVVDPQVINFNVVRSVRITWEVGKPRIGRTQHFHASPPSATYIATRTTLLVLPHRRNIIVWSSNLSGAPFNPVLARLIVSHLTV